MSEQIPVDKLVRMYMRMRAAVQDLDAQIEKIKAQQQEVKNEIKDRMMDLGTKAMKTEFGTVSLVEKTRFYTQDWESFKKFVVENDAVDLLEKRISQSNMKTFLEDNPSLVPPGLNSMSEFDVSVRKQAK